MNTLIAEEPGVDTNTEVKQASLMTRIILWYKKAVTQPATKQEEADWQQNSF